MKTTTLLLGVTARWRKIVTIEIALKLSAKTQNFKIMENTAHLLNEIDKKLMILLRDGRTLIGYLRSVDQFANLVLHRAIGKTFTIRFLFTFSYMLNSYLTANHIHFSERIHVNDKYGDMERGIFIIRGENVVLLGEIVRTPAVI